MTKYAFAKGLMFIVSQCGQAYTRTEPWCLRPPKARRTSRPNVTTFIAERLPSHSLDSRSGASPYQ